jgi:hypothetical protein
MGQPLHRGKGKKRGRGKMGKGKEGERERRGRGKKGKGREGEIKSVSCDRSVVFSGYSSFLN